MKCYLIAKKLSHSFSKPIHNELADYSYEYRELEENELASFFEKRDFDGLNVTIPYKQTVMPYLDNISSEAEKIGAVNTIVNRDGKLYGYNTDYYGFSYLLKSMDADVKDKDVVIIGNGGAAKTAFCVCLDKGAKSVRYLTRKENTPQNITPFLNAQIIVNATPVGMYPDTGKAPVNISQFKNCEAVVDMIYNPSRTKIIADAQKMGIKTANGLSMLVSQAKQACEIFTDTPVCDKKIEKICKKIENQTKNVILVGMPGSGKSTVGKELAKLLGREFFDSDDQISKNGKTPAQIIENEGEAEFRKVETKALEELCKKSSLVIATGGGSVTQDINFDVMHQNGTVVFLQRKMELLATKGRPLSQGGEDKIKKMYEVRLPMYKKFADIEVMSTEDPKKTARIIKEKIFGDKEI